MFEKEIHVDKQSTCEWGLKKYQAGNKNLWGIIKSHALRFRIVVKWAEPDLLNSDFQTIQTFFFNILNLLSEKLKVI